MTSFDRVSIEEFEAGAAVDLLAEHCAAFGGEGIHLWLSPVLAVALVGNLQLALRHPGNRGAAAAQARTIADAVVGQLARGDGRIEALLRRGDDPRCDVGPT